MAGVKLRDWWTTSGWPVSGFPGLVSGFPWEVINNPHIRKLLSSPWWARRPRPSAAGGPAPASLLCFRRSLCRTSSAAAATEQLLLLL